MRTDAGYTAYTAPDARELEAMLTAKLLHNFSVQPENAADEHYYNAGAAGRLYSRDPPGKREAGLLPVHGISDGALAEKHAV